jgi:hypothetical protein
VVQVTGLEPATSTLRRLSGRIGANDGGGSWLVRAGMRTRTDLVDRPLTRDDRAMVGLRRHQATPGRGGRRCRATTMGGRSRASGERVMSSPGAEGLPRVLSSLVMPSRPTPGVGGMSAMAPRPPTALGLRRWGSPLRWPSCQDLRRRPRGGVSESRQAAESDRAASTTWRGPQVLA